MNQTGVVIRSHVHSFSRQVVSTVYHRHLALGVTRGPATDPGGKAASSSITSCGDERHRDGRDVFFEKAAPLGSGDRRNVVTLGQ